MDDSTDGLPAHSNDDCSHSEGMEFSSDSTVYSQAVWSNEQSGSTKSQPISLAQARSRLKPSRSGKSAPRDVIVGSSRQARDLRDKIKLYAAEDAPVLIIGETGVGKELVARQLHQQNSRCDASFVPLNIGAVTETLSAAELFGHTKGAFTGALADRDGAFQMADGGSLFLDEIGDTPLSIQAQLLRVLDDGMVTKVGGRSPRQVDLRLIAATNVDLADAVRAGKFRRDLYYRINVLVIDVPPLRDRGDDVIEIAEAIIASSQIERHRRKKLTPSAIKRLMAHSFPGNVRELRNVITRAVVHATGSKICDEHITFATTQRVRETQTDLLDIAAAKDLVSRFVMIKALKIADGNVTQAAKLTGRARGTVHAMKKQLDGDDIASVYKSTCAQIKALIDDC